MTKNYFDIIEARHSIRAYKSRPVDQEKIQHILEAANRAPSAGNLQAYEIYMASESKTRTALAAAAYAQEFISQAPFSLIFCAHPARSAIRYGDRGERLYSIQDATIACTFAMLAAEALDLSTVWVGAFNEDQVRDIMGIPGTLRPIVILPVGYAGEEARKRSRRDIMDLVHNL